MVRLIIFDLDGVLVDIKDIHFNALNKALGSQFYITKEEHLQIYDGLKTLDKLKILSDKKLLPLQEHENIWYKKQKYTFEDISNLKAVPELIEVIKNLSSRGYKLALCSNSIRKTVLTVLSKLNIIEFFDVILSNEDVSLGKPYPEIYWKAMTCLKCLPEETLILEDSPPGLLAASQSRANILRVKNTKEVTLNNIMQTISDIENKEMKITPKWSDNELNVLIPMAGMGSRFQEAGYTFPKPLIEVNGKPMIQIVINNINVNANFIYIVQKKHREKYNLDIFLNLLTPRCSIVEVDGITEGAACTTLLAKSYINNDCPLFIANSDQFVEWDSNDFFYKMNESNADGGIAVFNATHPKWSFAKLNEQNLVVEVAEKKPISNIATVGFYYWKKGSDYVRYAERMIEKNIRTNNEFYICPVFNEALIDNKKIYPFFIKKMWGIGTPEDLNFFLQNYKKNL